MALSGMSAVQTSIPYEFGVTSFRSGGRLASSAPRFMASLISSPMKLGHQLSITSDKLKASGRRTGVSVSDRQRIGDRINRKMAVTKPIQRTKAQASTSLGASSIEGDGSNPVVQHTFGLPTAPGPNFANTFPMYDVTFTSIDFHKTIGHTINTLILLLPTIYFWNDPRWKFVLLAKLTLPEAVWEQATHYFTRQLHNVHKLKIIPLLVLDAIFFLNGGAQQVLAGPRDGLYWFMIYYFVVFMGGNLVEAFITFFGQYWPIKAPDSI